MQFGGIMLQIAICDDAPEHAEHLESMIRRQEAAADCQIERYPDSTALLERILSPAGFDVIFLDVGLSSGDSIAVAKRINRLLPRAQIIFISDDLSLAVDIFDAAHAYFLMKPVAPARLKCALDHAADNLRALGSRQILLPIRGSAGIVVNIANVNYFERMRRTTIVCTKECSSETNLKLNELEERLPPKLFARPHNSYLVNLSHVKKIERFCLHLDSGEILPVSNQRRPFFKEALAAYTTG